MGFAGVDALFVFFSIPVFPAISTARATTRPCTTASRTVRLTASPWPSANVETRRRVQTTRTKTSCTATSICTAGTAATALRRTSRPHSAATSTPKLSSATTRASTRNHPIGASRKAEKVNAVVSQGSSFTGPESG